MFSGDREIPNRGTTSTVLVGNEAGQVSHKNGGQEGWNFLVPLNTNDRFCDISSGSMLFGNVSIHGFYSR